MDCAAASSNTQGAAGPPGSYGAQAASWGLAQPQGAQAASYNAHSLLSYIMPSLPICCTAGCFLFFPTCCLGHNQLQLLLTPFQLQLPMPTFTTSWLFHGAWEASCSDPAE